MDYIYDIFNSVLNTYKDVGLEWFKLGLIQVNFLSVVVLDQVGP